MMARVREGLRWLRRAALDPGETPDRVAAAYALGVFFGFSPFLGFQILLSFSLAWAFRLNRPLVFLGLSTNLPWIVIPWYAGTTALAGALMGLDLADEARDHVGALAAASVWQGAFWHAAGDLLEAMLWPYLIGPTAGAAVLAAAAFVIVRRIGRRPGAGTPGTPGDDGQD